MLEKNVCVCVYVFTDNLLHYFKYSWYLSQRQWNGNWSAIKHVSVETRTTKPLKYIGSTNINLPSTQV